MKVSARIVGSRTWLVQCYETNRWTLLPGSAKEVLEQAKKKGFKHPILTPSKQTREDYEHLLTLANKEAADNAKFLQMMLERQQ